jgi:hypothetical protein
MNSQKIPYMVCPSSGKYDNSKECECPVFFHVVDGQPVFQGLTVCLAYLGD